MASGTSALALGQKKYRRRPDQVSYSAQVYCLGLLGSPPDPVHSVAAA